MAAVQLVNAVRQLQTRQLAVRGSLVLSCPSRMKSWAVVSDLPAHRQPSYRQDLHPSEKSDVKLDFTNHRNTFRRKSNWEITRALVTLSICSSQLFASNSLKMFNFSKRVLGDRLLRLMVKPLFYDQFVAGTTSAEISDSIFSLQRAGLHSIIAVAVEACNTMQEALENKEKTISMMKLLAQITTDKEHLMQFRMTGLFRMDLLMTLSRLLENMQAKFIGSAFEFMRTDCIDHLLWLPEVTGGGVEVVNEVAEGLRCLKAIGRNAVETNTVLMVDAEYTWINPALSMLTQVLSLQINRDKPMVWNTYQCYLKDSFANLKKEFKFAMDQDLCFGAKIVRGAYITPEKNDANVNQHASPVHDTYEETNASYDQAVEWLLSHMDKHSNRQKIRFVLASHNQESIKRAVNRLSKMDIGKQDRKVIFAQLYGMCDHISYTLANLGYPVYKSLAVGPIDETLPYLSRRAQENTTVVINARQERSLLKKELMSRLLKT